MTEIFSANTAGAPSKANVGRITLIVAIWAFLPIVAIGLLGAYYSSLLSFIPVHGTLTNFAAMRLLLQEILHGSHMEDSWGPMIKALAAVDGVSKNLLYETVFFSGHIRFQYPPTSLIELKILSSLHLLGIWTLNRLNAVVYLLNACALAFLSFSLFHRRSSGDRKPSANSYAMALLAFVGSFLFYPLMKGMLLGQVQVWIDLLFTATVIAWVKSYRGLSGFLIGIACSLKPQLGILLLWAILRGEWKFAKGILYGFAPFALLSIGFFGFHNNFEYLSVLTFLSRHGESYYPNNSVNGILNWYLSHSDHFQWTDVMTPYNPVVYAGTIIMSLAGLAIIVLSAIKRRGHGANLEDMSIAAIVSVVSGPIVWEHHYGILLPLYLVILRRISSGAKVSNISAIILVASWTLVANFIPFAFLLHNSIFAFVQAYCFFGALLLLWLFWNAGLPDRQSIGRAQSAQFAAS